MFFCDVISDFFLFIYGLIKRVGWCNVVQILKMASSQEETTMTHLVVIRAFSGFNKVDHKPGEKFVTTLDK